MRAKSHDIQWPVTAKTVEDINTNFDTLFESLNAFERRVVSSKGLHEILSAVHSDSVTANRIRGDLLTAQGTNPQWTRLAKGTTGFVLTMGATDPAWAAHNVLSATHGDTLAGSVVRGDVIIGNSTPKWARLAKGTSGYVLGAGASDVSWVDPRHNVLSATHLDATVASCVRGDLITGQGASPSWTRLAKGNAGDLLTMGANEPGWVAPATAVAHAMLSATHTDSTAAAVVRGDLLAGIGATPKWERLAKGTAGYVLTMGADEPAWATPAAPVAHQLDGALHTVSGLTPGHFLKALTATTFGFVAHGLAYGDVGAAAASHAHAWADVSKTGSSLADLATRAVANLSDGSNVALLNAANSFSLINPLTTIAESWIGPSATAGLYFKGGAIGIGVVPIVNFTALQVAGNLNPDGQPIALAVCDPSDATERITLGWNIAGHYGTIQAIASGVAVKTLVLQPLGGSILIGTTTASTVGFQVAGNAVPDGQPVAFAVSDPSSGVERITFGWNITGHYGTIQAIDSGTAVKPLILQPSGGATGFGTVAPLATVAINGGLHVGGDSDPGDNNLLIDGTLVAVGATQLQTLGAFAAGDKYLIVDPSGNLHISTLGPLA